MKSNHCQKPGVRGSLLLVVILAGMAGLFLLLQESGSPGPTPGRIGESTAAVTDSAKPDAPQAAPRDQAPTASTSPMKNDPKREDRKKLANLDRRESPAAGPTAAQQASLAELRKRVPGVDVQFDPVTGSANHVMAAGRFLTPAAAQAAPVNGDSYAPVRQFIDENAALFGHGAEALQGSRVTREDVAGHNGMRSVVWQQQVDAVPVYKTILRASLTKDGELITIGSHFLSDPETATQMQPAERAALIAQPPVDVAKAVSLAAAHLGDKVAPEDAHPISDPEGAERRQRMQAPTLSDTNAGLAWLPMSATSLQLTWDVTLMSLARNEMFRVLVDAKTGEVLMRTSLTNDISNASFRVYADGTSLKPYDSPTPMSPGFSTPTPTQPAGVSRNLITLQALDTTASPNGWINDGGTDTYGNNVDSHLDLSNTNPTYGTGTHATSATRVFDFTMDLTQDPTTYQSAAITNLFYLCNWYHDKMYAFGFTESAGNFQQNNFGRGGTGNDAVLADVQDGSGTNNANFSTPADGSPGRMQMYVFTGSTPHRDGDFDAEVVLHEHTHGLSNRLVGGGVGISALQPSGMGEGWSDFYGMTLLSDAADNVNGNYASGAYVSYLLTTGFTTNYYYGIRRYPYTTDMTKNPLTLKDIDPSLASPHTGIPLSPLFASSNSDPSEVHNQGEVWCVTLWEVRASLIGKLGYAAGNSMVLQLVTDGMKLAPANPTFLQSRDSIIQADLVDNAGANKNELWAAFAKRGMGSSASVPASSTTSGVVEAFDIPDNLGVTPAAPFASVGPVGGPFAPSVQTYTLTNTGASALNWTATNTQPWLTLSSAGGTLAGGASVQVTATVNSSATSLAAGSYPDTVAFTNVTSGAVLNRGITLRVGQKDYFTELFASGNDTSNQSWLFTPDGSNNFYSVQRTAAVSAFSTDPTGGTSLTMSDDTFVQVTPTGGVTVKLYGASYTAFYVGSNGYITFGSGDTNYTESLSSHFSLPRIAALFDDLIPTTGQVTWKQTADRLAVTWQGVPEYGTTDSNSFQIEMFFDGRICITCLGIAATDGLIGLSQGLGTPADYLASDFSTYPLNALPTVTTPSSTAITPTSATLGGNVTSDGGVAITERGVVYSETATNANPLIGGTGVTKVTSAGTTGVFTVNATGLTQGTGYSFKAYAINSNGTSYTTPVSTFIQGVPVVTAPTSAGITATSATLGGNVTGDGGAAITERGVVYAVTSVNGNPQIGGTGVTKVTSAGTTGVFTISATSLTQATGYSYSAYAINDVGTTYTTPVATFTTLAVVPKVTTPTQAAITTGSATLGGNVTSNGGATIIERGVVYSITATNADPLIGGTGVTKVTGTGTTGIFTVNATGLTQATGYSFKAYATNSVGTTYTTPASTFTTLLAVPLTGTKTLGTGGDYTSLTNTGGLFEAINGNGVNGSLSVQIIGNLTAETGAVALNVLTGTTPSLIIFPSGAARVISGSFVGALIRLNGADNVTLDGSLGGTGTDRSLTITNSSTTTPTVIALISLGTGLGATNDVIRNCNLSTGVATSIGYGISVGGSTPGTSGADNDNVTIQNNSITAAPVGIYASGTSSASAGGDDNLAIVGNSIAYNSTLASLGIRVGNARNSSVSQNTVSEQTTVTQAPTAISIETGFVSSSVTRNLITKSLTTSTSGYSGRGITVGTGTAASALTIANNIIYGVNGSNWSSFSNSSAMGIAIGTIGNSSTLTTVTGGVSLYFNSVNMTGSMGTASSAALTAALYVGSGASALDLRNNVFVNTQVGTSTTQKNYAIYSAATSAAFTTIDFNVYFVSNTFNAASAIPGFLVSDRVNLAGIQAGFGQNTHSLLADPLFTSATDLHITSGLSPVANAGTPIAGVLVDFDGDTRSPATPDIGADESIATSPPVVSSPTQTAITATSATLGGNVTSDSGSAITERGVVYSVTTVNADPLIGGAGVVKLTSPGTTGIFTVNATGLTAGAGYSFKAYANNGAGTAYTSPVSTLTTLTPLNNWRLFYFGTTSNSGNAADAADPYFTGVPNLAVFAILGPNQDPSLVAAGMLPQPQRIGGNPTITFPVPAGVSGVTYAAEWSTTLLSGSWTPIFDLSNGPTRTFSAPAAGNPNLFMRLRVSSP